MVGPACRGISGMLLWELLLAALIFAFPVAAQVRAVAPAPNAAQVAPPSAAAELDNAQAALSLKSGKDGGDLAIAPELVRVATALLLLERTHEVKDLVARLKVLEPRRVPPKLRPRIALLAGMAGVTDVVECATEVEALKPLSLDGQPAETSPQDRSALDAARKALDAAIDTAAGYLNEATRSTDRPIQIEATIERALLDLLAGNVPQARTRLDQAMAAIRASARGVDWLKPKLAWVAGIVALREGKARPEVLIQQLRGSVRESQRLVGNQHPYTARLRVSLAQEYVKAGNGAEATKEFTAALGFWSAVADDGSLWQRYAEAGGELLGVGRVNDAAMFLKRAMRLRLAGLPPDDPRRSDLLASTVIEFVDMEAPKPARAGFLEILVDARDPVVAESEPSFPLLLGDLAHTYAEMRLSERSQATYARAWALRKRYGHPAEVQSLLDRAVRTSNEETATMLFEASDSYSWAHRDVISAYLLAAEAARIRLTLLGPAHKDADAAVALAAAYEEEVINVEAAINRYDDFAKRLKTTADRDHNAAAVSLRVVAESFASYGRPNEAASLRLDAEYEILAHRLQKYRAASDLHPVDSLDVRLALDLFSQQAIRLGQFSEPVDEWQAFIVRLIKARPNDNFTVDIALGNFAQVLRDAKRPAAAEVINQLKTVMGSRSDPTALCRRTIPDVADTIAAVGICRRAVAATKPGQAMVPPNDLARARARALALSTPTLNGVDATATATETRRAQGGGIASELHRIGTDQARDPGQREAALWQLLAAQEARVPRNPATEATILAAIGTLNLEQLDAAVALVALSQAASTLLAEELFDDAALTNTLRDFLRAAHQQGSVDEASEVLDRAIVAQARGLPEDHPVRQGVALLRLEEELLSARTPDAAVAILAGSKQGLAGSRIGGTSLDAQLRRLASLYKRQDEAEPAYRLARTVLDRQKMMTPPSHAVIAETALHVAVLAQSAGLEVAAAAAIDDAISEASVSEPPPVWLQRISGERDAVRAAQAQVRELGQSGLGSLPLLDRLRLLLDAQAYETAAEEFRKDSASWSNRWVRLIWPGMLAEACGGTVSVFEGIVPGPRCKGVAWTVALEASDEERVDAERQSAEMPGAAARRMARRAARQQLPNLFAAAAAMWEVSRDDGERAILKAIEAADFAKSSALSDGVTALVKRFPDGNGGSASQTGDLTGLRDSLIDDEAFVSYVALDDHLHAFVVTRNAAVHRSWRTDFDKIIEMTSRVRAAADPSQLAVSGIPEFPVAVAHALWSELLSPLASDLAGISRLRLSPDGVLWAVPFAALITEQPEEDRWLPAAAWRPRWMGEHVAMSFVPTGRAHLQSRVGIQRSGAPRAFLGLGAPSLRQLDFGAAPKSSDQIYSGGRVNQEALRNLPEVAGAIEELSAMRDLFATQGATILAGPDFTETALAKRALDQWRVLTLATHGFEAGSDGSGALPGLVMTPPAMPMGRDDGFLTPPKIAELRLDADLVILSACNSAGGDLGSAQHGALGIASAFFFAGARAALVSRWPVMSTAAAVMTLPVAAAIARRDPDISLALRDAIRAMASDERMGELRHPMAWAPFTLIGSAR